MVDSTTLPRNALRRFLEGVSGDPRGGPLAKTNRLKPQPAREAMEAIDFSGATYATLGPQCAKEAYVANSFGSDIIFETEDPQKAAAFYVAQLGFEVTDVKPNMISLHGNCINMFIERGPSLGPVFEITVDSVEEAKVRLVKNGCTIVKDEPEFPRCYVKDPYGLIYNLTT